MSCIHGEREVRENFENAYRIAQSDAWLEVERRVCGCDYGGTSWTTRLQADHLGQLLNLGPGTHLLEIGAGSGWPALYLAALTGCDATLTDVPLEGLRVAGRRSQADGLSGRISIAQASGVALPFEAGRFDSISHSDVLCCLEAKLSVLKESRRVIRPGGSMVFTVIHTPSGVSADDSKRAAEAGPTFVNATQSYPDMLRRSGWGVTHHADLTADYEETVRKLLSEQQARSDGLSGLLGADEFNEMLAKHRATIAAIGEGLLQRSLFAAVPVR